MDPQDINAAPSVQEVTQQLLAGVPEAPSGGGEPALPAGFRLEQPAPAAAPPPATAEDVAGLQRELAALRERAEAADRRVADNQANYHRADSGRQTAEALYNAINAQRQREAALYQQAVAMQPPQFEDPDALLSDGKNLLGAMHRYGQWVEGRVLAQLAPYVQQFAGLQEAVQSHDTLTRRQARAEAKRMVEQDLGGQDFDQVWPEIESSLNQPGGQALLRDPDALFKAYGLVALSRGRNPLARPATSPTPPSADPRPTPGTPSSRLSPQLGAMARHIGKTLGLPGGDIPMTKEDIGRLMADLGGG